MRGPYVHCYSGLRARNGPRWGGLTTTFSTINRTPSQHCRDTTVTLSRRLGPVLKGLGFLLNLPSATTKISTEKVTCPGDGSVTSGSCAVSQCLNFVICKMGVACSYYDLPRGL